MVNRWAMIENNVVVNICLWDGLVTTWQPPAGVEMVLAPDHIGRDWKYENGKWIEPVYSESNE